jgi:toxin FitB
VTRYLLDTNIVSNIIKPMPSHSLLTWMSEQDDESLFISTVTIAEIKRDIIQKPNGIKRRNLEEWFCGIDGLQALFAGRILSFDEKSALVWAKLMVEGKEAGITRDAIDMIIASIAEVNNCIIVTDNERDFVGLKIINPIK